jgi:hypothetical protein
VKVNAQNPETGEIYEEDIVEPSPGFLDEITSFELSDENIRRMIDNLSVSADVKVLLYKFSKATLKLGQVIVKIGRKIIDFVCLVYKEYPNATFGLIFGAIAGFLVGAIPLIGAVLGAFFTPIAMGLGLIGGLKEDLDNAALERRIAEINAKFEPLHAQG